MTVVILSVAIGVIVAGLISASGMSNAASTSPNNSSPWIIGHRLQFPPLDFHGRAVPADIHLVHYRPSCGCLSASKKFSCNHGVDHLCVWLFDAPPAIVFGSPRIRVIIDPKHKVLSSLARNLGPLDLLVHNDIVQAVQKGQS